MVTGTTTVSELKDGIYFGLDEDRYHADPALGSSNLRDLAKNPEKYWWRSSMNPLRPSERATPSQVRGTAVHVHVLYGPQEFQRRYLRIGHEDWMSPAEKGAVTRAANKEAEASGLTALPAETYDSVIMAGAMIALNPHLSKALIGGLNEVSVFWHDQKTGNRKKARFDVLKPRGIGDLKSLANKLDKPFEQACRDSISSYRYDAQAAHYMDGRRQMPGLYKAGLVTGAHNEALMQEIVAAKTWGWAWVFWQAEDAPITHSYVLSPGNPMLELGSAIIARGEENYKAYMERFGTSQWVRAEPPRELYVDDMPAWFARD